MLRRYGVVSDDDRVNKSVVLALVDAIMKNELFIEEVLNYVLKYYKAELIERVGGAIPRIELKWSEDFEMIERMFSQVNTVVKQKQTDLIINLVTNN